MKHTSLAVLSALSLLAPTGLIARELDGTSALVTSTDPPDMWELRNNAQLTVQGGRTLGITAADSGVTLMNAMVARNSAFDLVSIELTGASLLDTINSRISDGGVLIRGASEATFSGSHIVIDETAQGFAGLNTVGIAITMGNADVRLDGSSIEVVDNPDRESFNSGVGIRQSDGRVALLNGSRITAANIGSLLYGTRTLNRPLTLDIAASDIVAGRGPALQVAPGSWTNTYTIHVTDGSTLQGGDGNLLLVSNGAIDAPESSNNLVSFVARDVRLAGNITQDESAAGTRLNVYLEDNAQLTGRMHGVHTLTIHDTGTWRMNGDSRLGHVTVFNEGQLVLGDGSTFNTLTLDSFGSTGGTLVFNTRLEGDDSATDKLVVEGDASGQAQVRVHNVGGQGAQTLNGILLIEVGGESRAVFSLQGRAVGGQYEYFLFKESNGNWYLRSRLDDGTGPEPDPCRDTPALCEITLPVEDDIILDPGTPDGGNEVTLPVLPDIIVDPPKPTPQPVLRPETGAYLANDAAMGQLMQHRAGDRGAMSSDDGLRTWASVDAGARRMEAIGQQALKADHSRVQIGADVGVFDGGNGRIGALLSAGRADITSRSTVTGYHAQGEVRGGALGVYGGWDNGTTFVDASVQQGRFRNQVQGDGLALERYAARVSQVSVEAGHGFDAGHVGSMGLTIQPELQLTYTGTEVDVHVENNGTLVERMGGGGLGARLGVRVLGEVGQPGRARLYGSVHVIDDGAALRLSFDGEVLEGGAPRRAVEVGAGAQLQLRERVSVWGGLNFGRGSDRYRELGAKVGVAYRW